ncbi:MAG: hypothetical protein HY209_07800 [Candidatus Omnitrophica bacterium]|nr:hypothetical protein [Candidatus Omnitrophota bacterium]
MNRISKILVFAFLVLLPQTALSADQIITLKDGSQIKGELISAVAGVYTIHTPTMGDIKINASQVATIANAQIMPAANPDATPSPSDDVMNQKIRSAQTKLMGDPEMMAEIQEMVKDPELMQLLLDPTLTQEVMSHDTKAIQNNPKAQELINNPKMRALMDKLRSKNTSP